MKKILLLSSMAVLGLTAAAQGVDPATYGMVGEYSLVNRWMMSVGDVAAENGGIARKDWANLPLVDESGNYRSRSATILGDKVYIGASQTWDAANSAATDAAHLVELDLATGKFIRDIQLTLNGETFAKFMGVNSIGHDDYGHLWVSPINLKTFDDTTLEATPFEFYTVDLATGALTLEASLALTVDDGLGCNGRVDYVDLIGDITGKENRAVAMGATVAGYIYQFHRNQGETEWKGGNNDQSGKICVQVKKISPESSSGLGGSIKISIVRDAEFSGDYVYIDGQQSYPALYDNTGTLIESIEALPAATEGAEDVWAAFRPNTNMNGVRQFLFDGEQYVGWAMVYPDERSSVMGGHMALARLDENESFIGATPMWVFPEGKLGSRHTAEFGQSVEVNSEYVDANGNPAIDILDYKGGVGIALYTLTKGEPAGVNDLVIENNNAPVEYFNLNGVRVNENNLTTGLYIKRQGLKASKVVVK